MSNNDLCSQVFCIDIVVVLIQEHLPIADLFNLRNFSKQWKRCFKASLASRTVISLPHVNGYKHYWNCSTRSHWKGGVLRTLKTLTLPQITRKLLVYTINLQALNLWDVEIGEEDLQLIVEQPFCKRLTLKHLEIVRCKVRRFSGLTAEQTWSDFFKTLTNLEHLTLLENTGFWPPNSKLGSMIRRNCLQLSYFNISKNLFEEADDDGSDWTIILSRLTSAAMYNCPLVTFPEGMNELDRMQTLDISNTVFDIYELPTLNQVMPNLRKLKFTFHMDDVDYSYIELDTLMPKFNNLVELYLFVDQSCFMKDAIKIVIDSTGPTLEVLWLANVCLCKSTTQHFLTEKCVNLREFRHLKTSYQLRPRCYFNADNCYKIRHHCLAWNQLSHLAQLPKINTVQIDNFAHMTHFIKKDYANTTLRNFIFKRLDSESPFDFENFFKIPLLQPSERFTLTVDRTLYLKTHQKHNFPSNLKYTFF
jgi:hypothetical protein